MSLGQSHVLHTITLPAWEVGGRNEPPTSDIVRNPQGSSSFSPNQMGSLGFFVLWKTFPSFPLSTQEWN